MTNSHNFIIFLNMKTQVNEMTYTEMGIFRRNSEKIPRRMESTDLKVGRRIDLIFNIYLVNYLT